MESKIDTRPLFDRRLESSISMNISDCSPTNIQDITESINDLIYLIDKKNKIGIKKYKPTILLVKILVDIFVKPPQTIKDHILNKGL